MQQFNPIDAALLFTERTRTPMHVNMINIYDPSTCPGERPGFEDIMEAVRVSLPVAPSFRRKIVRVPLDLDYPYWVEDENFELEFHMRHLSLPRPGTWEQFRTQVSRLVSRPLDLTRPPWEITVVEGLDSIEGLPPGCFAMVLKIHHCAIDGQSGVTMVTALHQDSPHAEPSVLPDDWAPEHEPTRGQLLRDAWIASIRQPLKIVRLVLANAPGLLRSAYWDLVRAEDRDDELHPPETRFHEALSAHRVFDDVNCTLDQLKSARNRVEGATINDVCLAIVAGAMRSYLQAHDELPDEPLVSVVPISIRTPEQVAAGGNQLAVMRVSLHTDIADPGECLSAIAKETRSKKAVQDGVVMSTLLDVVYNLPGALVGTVSRILPIIGARAKPVANTMVTNVPGPMNPMYFLGARHIYSTGCPPLGDGMGIAHSVCSYEGKFLFSFCACRDQLPDVDFYKQCLQESMEAVCGISSEPKQSRGKGRKSTRPKSRR